MSDSLHLGLEAGGTKMIVGLGAADGSVVAREAIPTTTPGETIPAIRAAVSRLTGGRRAATLGIATFGPAQTLKGRPRYGFITTTPKPGWTDTDLLGELSGLADRAAFDTDVNGAALAEAMSWGQGAPLAYVTVGTGIGVGVAAKGRTLTGTAHFEGGHVPVPRAPGDEGPCICPFHDDCAEGLAAGPAWHARLGHSLSDEPEGSPARAQAAYYLGQLCRTLAFAHAPGRIVMGGGVMKTPGLLNAARAEADRLIGGYGPGLPEIVAPMLGDDAGLRGAILLGRAAD